MKRRRWLYGGLLGAGAGLSAWLTRGVDTPPHKPAVATSNRAIVIYSPAYRVSFFGLERLHPFDIGK